MNEKPILFSGPMLKAIIAGTNTMTRRIVKDEWQLLPLENPDYQREVLAKAPFQPRARRWVQETHTVTDWDWDSGATSAVVVSGYYDSDRTPISVTLTERESILFLNRKKKRATVPGRFMYRSLSRITLEIESVRVERVQDINEADAEAEGVGADPNWRMWHVFTDKGSYSYGASGERLEPIDGTLDDCGHKILAHRLDVFGARTARSNFEMLWSSIHAKRGHGWDTNPWVWCVTFRRFQP